MELTMYLKLGYRIARVKCIFAIPSRTKKTFFTLGSQPSDYLAYVEWFHRESRARPHHQLYCVKKSLNEDNDQLASVIPYTAIHRSIQLFPAFGKNAPIDWSSDNVLDKCNTFFVNSFQDRHSYHTIV